MGTADGIPHRLFAYLRLVGRLLKRSGRIGYWPAWLSLAVCVNCVLFFSSA